MPMMRLAYTTLYLIALLAVFELWSQVGGQSHLDLMPWYIKLVLAAGAAFCVVKAAAGAVAGERAWNRQTLRWAGILLVLLIGCGLATYYVHLYGEEDEQDEQSVSRSGKVLAPARRPKASSKWVSSRGTAPRGTPGGSGSPRNAWTQVGQGFCTASRASARLFRAEARNAARKGCPTGVRRNQGAGAVFSSCWAAHARLGFISRDFEKAWRASAFLFSFRRLIPSHNQASAFLGSSSRALRKSAVARLEPPPKAAGI